MVYFSSILYIDSAGRSIKLISSQGHEVVKIGFYDMMGEVGSDVTYKTFNTDGGVVSSTRIMGGRIMRYSGDTEQENILMDIGSIRDNNILTWKVNRNRLPAWNNAYAGEVCLDGDTLKVKR